MARLNSTQKLKANVERNEVLLDVGWNKFKTTMVYLGGITVLAWILYGGYQWGKSNSPTVAPSTISSITAVPTPKPKEVPVTTPRVSASSSSTASTPPVVVKFPEHLTVELKEITPPQSVVQPPPAPVDPTANMTPAERRRYEIWVQRK